MPKLSLQQVQLYGEKSIFGDLRLWGVLIEGYCES
jgi:hypothetical protein